MLLLSSADNFQNYFFQKILTGTVSVCRTIWIQIRTNILWVLNWVQTVFKGYQQKAKFMFPLKLDEMLHFSCLHFSIQNN